MTDHATARSHPLRALSVALAIVTVLMLATAPRASALDMSCNYDGRTFNACLRLDLSTSYSYWDGHIGIDVNLPAQYAREIVDCGADMTASLWGDDGGGNKDHLIRNFVISPGWPAAGDNGFGAEFFTRFIHRDMLDEDRGSDPDELYAKITYRDCHIHQIFPFRTGTIRARF